MSGAFRFIKSIIASLGLAAIAFLMQYGQNFLFRSVEQPQAQIFASDDNGLPRQSLSPQRSLPKSETALWNIAVVTNRVLETTNGQSPGSLVDQTKDALYQTPDTIYGRTPVSVSLRRKRGSCKAGPEGVDVGQLATMSRSSFLAEITDSIAQGSGKDVLVFIHGFNVSLEQATARAAQVAEDMPFHGTMIVFSWQSAARTRAYRDDEKLAERYFWNLAELLANLKQTCDPNTRLHVLAHSMGNRVTLRAMEALCGTMDPVGHRDPMAFARFFGRTKSSLDTTVHSVVTVEPEEIKQRFPEWGLWHPQTVSRPQIDTLILVAPDVGVAEFSKSIQNIQPACERMILYSSDSDYALQGSRRLHGKQYRAGDSRAKLNIAGLHTVKVSGVNTLDPLGHSYYGSNPKVLRQLAGLLGPKFAPNQTVTQFAKRQTRAGQHSPLR